MDSKDGLILDQLVLDSRQSTALISRKTGIPRVTVHDHLAKLVQNSVIRRFTVSLDYAKLDLPITTFVLVSYEPSARMDQHALARKISELPGVYAVHIISGEWDLFVKMRSRSIQAAGELIIDKIRLLHGVHKTLSMTCFETVKEE